MIKIIINIRCRLLIFLSSAAFEVGVFFFCTYKNSSSFGISLFFSSTTHNVALQKKKHVLLGSTGHDACDPLRGSGEKQKQTGGRCQRGIRYVLRSGGEEESRKSNRQSPTDANFVGRFEREWGICSRYRPVKRVGNAKDVTGWRGADRE